MTDSTVISEEKHKQECRRAESMPWYVRIWQTTILVNIHIAMYEMKGNNNTQDITPETSCEWKQRRKPNKQCILAFSMLVCLCVFACIPREWFLCFTHIVLPNWWIYWNASSEPENLNSSKRRCLNKEWEGKNKKKINKSLSLYATNLPNFSWSTYCK